MPIDAQQTAPDPPPISLPCDLHGPAPDGQAPLHGLTLLVVEDSRFACDALRLLCQRAGARLRRAETLHAARAHLRVYRPDVVIVDLGLPDGRGEGLIRDLALQNPRRCVVLGSSGDLDGRAAALAAGANGFLEKPIESLTVFQNTILRHVNRAPQVPISDPPLHPDPLALHDDLTRAASLMAAAPDPLQTRYVARFVGGLARSAHDAALQVTAADVCRDPTALPRLAALVDARLATSAAALINPLFPDQTP